MQTFIAPLRAVFFVLECPKKVPKNAHVVLVLLVYLYPGHFLSLFEFLQQTYTSKDVRSLVAKRSSDAAEEKKASSTSYIVQCSFHALYVHHFAQFLR